MRLIDEIHLRLPFYGSRRIGDELEMLGHRVNRKRIQRLMRLMGVQTLYRQPRTSIPDAGHKIYPYLLRGMQIDRPNQVWATDITYVPMAKGFVYVVAIMDWATRKVLSWRVSTTMETGFCIAALEEALQRYGLPEIFNSDQGSQFTSVEFTSVLEGAGVRISMDGRGRWLDNVFVERLWRSLKYEEVYLFAYDTVAEARQRIGAWFEFYNTRRRHQSLGMTPQQAYMPAQVRTA